MMNEQLRDDVSITALAPIGRSAHGIRLRDASVGSPNCHGMVRIRVARTKHAMTNNARCNDVGIAALRS
jgi:hypothetical protein